MRTCIHKLSCEFYAKADHTASYRILKSDYCELAPEKWEINRRYQDSRMVLEHLLPDGTTEG